LPRFDAVLFDLDGTLVDSNALTVRSLGQTAEAVLGRRFPEEQLAALVGGGSAARQLATLDSDRVDELVRDYGERIGPAYDEVACFAGMVEVLTELKRRGTRLAVVSAKRRDVVERAFAAAGIAGYFEAVVGAEDTERHKPDPEPLLKALQLLGAEAATAAYVGDSPYDAEAARAAGLYAVAVAWGGLHRVEDADVLVETPEELLAVL
jgi:pyrophosphatase PpaX